MSSPRRIHRLLLVAACGSLSAAHVSAAPLPPPSGDAFYVPPTPLPLGEPGAPIWYRASSFGGSLTVRAWQVLYRSTSATDQPNAVSGTVLVPIAPYASGPRPLVTFAPGTQGMGDACAASKGIANGSLYEAAIITDALNRGWAVAVSDYEGLGTPGEHTYVVNLSLGHAVLDVARAARGIPETGIGANNPIAIWGYSEGGGAAAAAAELEATYAPELSVVAAAAGAAPSDLVRAAQYLDGQLGFAPVFIGGMGYDAAYPELDLPAYLNDLGKQSVAIAREQCIFQLVPQFAFHRMSEYTTQNPMDQAAYRERLEENRLGKRKPRMPIYYYHAQGDEVIPYDTGVSLRDSYCARGASVTFKSIPGSEHIAAQLTGYGEAAAWLADRFAGKPALNSCPASGSGGTGGTGPVITPDCGCRVAGATQPSSWFAAPLLLGLALLAGRRRRCRSMKTHGDARACAS